MDWQCYSIMGTSFRFGRGTVNQETCSVTFPSDSLFAAMVSTAALLVPAEDFNAWIAEFQQGDPPFLLTSVFPRAGEVQLFPIPQIRERLNVEKLGLELKDLKKTAFISESLYLRILNGESTAIIYDPAESTALQGSKVRVAKADYERLPKSVKNEGRIWGEEKRPRVTLDRVSNMSAIYFTAHTGFLPGCGLWFALNRRKEAAIAPEQLLEVLAIQGLGAERSAGFGSCRIEPAGTLQLPDAEKAPRWTTLSRWLPAPDEVPAALLGSSGYALEEVGGWLNSPGKKAERRRTIRMIAEGAVLRGLGKSLYGSMADVQPDYNGTSPVGHPVWRSGFAAAVGMAERSEA